jgi:DNA polymerase elongation subunit (family B)
VYIDAIHIGDKIIGWIRDTEGKLIKFEEPAPYYCYQKNPNGKYKSLFGDNLSLKKFKSRKKYLDFVDASSSISLFESDISSLYKFLSDTFYNSQPTNVNIGYFDIESDYNLKDGKGYPTPENPHGEINSITIYDVKQEKYHCIILTDDKSIILKDNDNEVITYHCATERQLLDTFYRLIKDIDVLSGWHSEGYDVPYIMARTSRLYGDKGNHYMCRDGTRVRMIKKLDNFNNEIEVPVLTGRVNFDLLLLYKRFTFGERENYKLDTIAKLEIGTKKLEYDGDLGDLYRSNPRKFFEYNLHDCRLLKKIDEKMKMIDLGVAMARQATIKFTDIFGSIKYLEQSIMNYCHFDRGEMIVLPNKNKDNVRGGFKGAFVLETKPGTYKWTQSIDLASLYPSVIRSINISPETHILQCRNRHEDFVKIIEQTDDDIILDSIMGNGTTETKAYDVYELLKDENFTISANGSIFINKQGLIPEVLTLWYSERSETKELSKDYARKKDIVNRDFYSMREQLLKQSLNSLYGAISNPYSRFYSLDLAASITLTGREINKFQIWRADQIVIGNT